MLYRFLTVFVLLLNLYPSVIYADHQSAAESGKPISPVYEHMLANQIYNLRRELLSHKQIQKNDSFYVLALNDQLLAESVRLALKKNYPSINWEADPKLLPAGVLLVEDSAQMKQSDLGQKTSYVLIFSNEEENPDLIDQLARQGFKLHSDLAFFELEYAQDERGRQIVDLDQTRFRNQIFERLVREGMNPVQAHSEAEEAVKNFRKLKHPKLLIFDRIFG